MKILVSEPTSKEYLDFLKLMFNGEEITEVIFDPKKTDAHRPQDIDLVLFTGGADVSPNLYREEIGKFTSINKERDKLEFRMLDHTYHNTPKLGICRGAQLLTVANGGRLIQHVNGHGQTHKLHTLEGIQFGESPREYVITSSHHQMMYPFTLRKNNFKLIAWSKFFKSNTYLNGNNEEKKLPESFLEPEIIYYPQKNSLCIQGHPEYKETTKQTLNFVKKLIDKYLIK